MAYQEASQAQIQDQRQASAEPYHCHGEVMGQQHQALAQAFRAQLQTTGLVTSQFTAQQETTQAQLAKPLKFWIPDKSLSILRALTIRGLSIQITPEPLTLHGWEPLSIQPSLQRDHNLNIQDQSTCS